MVTNEIIHQKLAQENVSLYSKIFVDISWQNCWPFHITSLLAMASLGGPTQIGSFLFVSCHLRLPGQKGLGQCNVGIGITALHNRRHFHCKNLQLKDSFLTRNTTGSAKANGRESKSCFGGVFSFKLCCFALGNVLYGMSMHTELKTQHRFRPTNFSRQSMNRNRPLNLAKTCSP